MNKRLGTHGLNVNEAYMESQKRGITIPSKFCFEDSLVLIFYYFRFNEDA